MWKMMLSVTNAAPLFIESFNVFQLIVLVVLQLYGFGLDLINLVSQINKVHNTSTCM